MATADVQSQLTDNEANFDIDISESFAPDTVRSAVHSVNGDFNQL